MSFVTQLNDGLTIPSLGFGVGSVFKGKSVSDAVKGAIEVGFTHIDGAQYYENEDTMGDGLQASGYDRSRLYVTTKLGPLAKGATVRQSLVASLEKLKLDYVDLFLIHAPIMFKTPEELVDVWKQFEDLQREGLAKSIGVANFKVEDLKLILPIAKIVPAVNQVEYHPFQVGPKAELLQLHKEYGIVTASYGGNSPLFREDGPKDLDPVLSTISERLSTERGDTVTTSHVLMKWLFQRSIIVVTTSTKTERLKSYLDVYNVPDLSEAELTQIDKIGAAHPYKWFPLF